MKHLPLPSMKTHAVSCQRGFTLIETLVTVSLLAIVTSLAIPSFAEFLRQWRRDSATRELSTSIQLARSEAIKSTRQLVVCPSTDGATCSASTEWRGGWIVFVDDGAGTQANANNQARDANERVLRVVSEQAGVATLTSSGGVQVLSFLPNGLMGSDTTTLTVTASGAASSTKVDRIAVSRVGRITITTETP